MTEKFKTEIQELTGISHPEDGNDEKVFILLCEAINGLLASSDERLMQVLYRLDVPENKVRQVFKEALPENWPADLARLILEREKERLYWREKYRNESKP